MSLAVFFEDLFNRYPDLLLYLAIRINKRLSKTIRKNAADRRLSASAKTC